MELVSKMHCISLSSDLFQRMFARFFLIPPFLSLHEEWMSLKCLFYLLRVHPGGRSLCLILKPFGLMMSSSEMTSLEVAEASVASSQFLVDHSPTGRSYCWPLQEPFPFSRSLYYEVLIAQRSHDRW